MSLDSVYIRIAQVVRVAHKSRELDITFIDGEIPANEVIRAEVIYGVYNRDRVQNSPTPSAAIVGKGDRVVVLVVSEIYYVVSRLDRFDIVNNNRVAVYPENILYDLLGSLCIGSHFVNNGSSYADFIDGVTGEITRLECDNTGENTNRIAWRLLRRLALTYMQNLNFIEIDYAGYPRERAGGGAMPTQPLYYNGTIRHKNTINNIPYVHDIPFGQTNYTGDLSIYSGLLSEVEKGECHPLCPYDTVKVHYDGATYIWFDDPDPEWVVVISVYPSWDLTKYIKFLEVPVYGWAERMAYDTEDGDLVADRTDQVEYARYEDSIRELDSITRSWLDWGVIANDWNYSETFHRALSVPAKRTGPNSWSFAILDGYGYSNGSFIFSFANEQRVSYGTITREISGAIAANGSPYTYNISYDAPTAVDLWYDLIYSYYDDDAGTKYESQVTTQEIENRTYIIYTNGIDRLYKKVAIDYYSAGGYASYPWGVPGSWDFDEGLGDTHNVFREYIYWNSLTNLIATYEYDFWYTVSNHTFHCKQSTVALHYVNIEAGLFVIEKIKMECYNTLGPGALLASGTRSREYIVWYQGDEYILFEVNMPYDIGTDDFPGLWNYWPWMMDANTPYPPASAPYDYSETFSSVFFLQPFMWVYVEPMSPYVVSGAGYPTIQGDITSALFAAALNTDQEDLKPEYLQVFFDPKTEGWVIKLKNIYALTGSRSIDFPDGGGDIIEWTPGSNALYKIGDDAPTFTKPSISKTITL